MGSPEYVITLIIPENSYPNNSTIPAAIMCVLLLLEIVILLTTCRLRYKCENM